MTAEKYAHTHYGQFVNYKAVSKESFQAGLNQGRDESKTDRIAKLEKEVKELREYKKDKEDLFYDSERLGEFLAGL